MKPEEFFDRVKQECIKNDIDPYILYYDHMDTQYYTHYKNNKEVDDISDIGIYQINRKIESNSSQDIWHHEFSTMIGNNMTYKFFVFINNKNKLDFKLVSNNIGYDLFYTKNAIVGCNYSGCDYTITSIYNDDTEDTSIYVRDISGLIRNNEVIKLTSEFYEPPTERYGLHMY